MSGQRVAIVGIGLRYPDANSPIELWENVLSGRRAFRRLPDERMNHADYWSPDRAAPDRFYATKAAVLRDFEFDRIAYSVAGSTYRSTDLTHWLALDTAARALADAGFPGGSGLPGQTTGVVVGNSLTGEFSRANIMRLRWPYVRRTVAAALAGKGWSESAAAEFLEELEQAYKAPFPPIDEDSLAGGLANTIAGRICNHFDLRGGGYTVDGACSSSLLSVITAARSLADGDLDVALAGGVDLSIDPFEVIGFAKTGALATGEMKVYDRDSNGFWPGEGSGMLVLMREEDALAASRRIYASIAGWGVSSDGKGGITRPEAGGHRLALARAYRQAGYGVETVSYFEGHGTGTALGDATEIEALSSARRAADPVARPAALGTVKGNFGHTKAAAGVAGLIKAALAVHHQVIPPGTGHHDPHPGLLGDDAALYVPGRAELWPADSPVRAGVSAMGFGGINTHVAVTAAPAAPRRTALDADTGRLVAGRQDAELLLLEARDRDGLRAEAARLLDLVPRLAQAELADLAAGLAAGLADGLTGAPVRAAVVATSPDDAARALERLLGLLASGATRALCSGEGVFLGTGRTEPTIAYLFPGQGSGRGAVGAIRRRFAQADEVYRRAGLPTGADQVDTRVAQPRIVTGSLAALRVLDGLGIRAAAAVGHSLGELTALHWAGALTEDQVLRLATVRGQVMAEVGSGGGAMAGLAATPEDGTRLCAGLDVVIAGYNGPRQTVVSGPAAAVDEVCRRAVAEGVTATRLNVSHAFHSPLVAPAAHAMAERLGEFDFARPVRPVASTVTGALLDPAADLRTLLRDQVARPVRFHEAAAAATADADLVVEVGPGRVLSGLLAEIAPDRPALAVDTDSSSLGPLLRVAAAAFVLGSPVRAAGLFEGRLVRPLPADGAMTFLASPCESAPAIDAARLTPARPAVEAATGTATAPAEAGGESTLDLLRRLAAERVELPLESVTAATHPMDDLHLSSITVGQIVNDVTRALGLPALEATTSFATVGLGELAELIDRLAQTAEDGPAPASEVPGVAPWVRPFAVEHVEAALPARTAAPAAATGSWTVYSTPGHPLAEPLRTALAEAGIGDGVLLCLPAECGAGDTELFLAAGRAAATAPGGTRLVVVQHRLGATGLAKTLHLEHPSVPTTVVELPDPLAPEAVGLVVAEAAATTGFTEVRYGPDGRRTVPVLRPLTPTEAPAGASPLDEADVLLVTGGGKGITAECALAMARDSGAALALIGRADPAEDAELAANLARMTAAGLRLRYERADVTSAAQTAEAVERLEHALGPVTAVLHGAGRNEPAAVTSLTPDDFRRTLAPKTDGLAAVLDAVAPERLKLLITFGSIIGRAGLRGEAHYATANDWMTELTLRFAEKHPQARVLAIEWSVWSGAGMGERLGVVEALMREGITPISTEEGIRVLRELLADPSAGPVLVVSGRAAGLPTLALEQRDLPLARFLERVVTHYPGVELVTEAELSEGSDPYLTDHQLDGDLLFPAVLGMEAMAQAAAAVSGHQGPPMLEAVEFLRPIAVRPGGSTTLRTAALVQDTGTVDVVLRTSDTGFAADHFRARLRYLRPALPDSPRPAALDLPAVPVDPVTELYGSVLFQGKRFQRLLDYRRAGARHAVAEVSTTTPAPWFAAYLPQEQLLADPGTRDTMMHAIQCCVPDATLLPRGIERLHLAERADQDSEFIVLDARERSQDGDTYVYDVDVRTPDGRVVERWEGLALVAVRKRDGAGPWVPAMLGSYLERGLERVLGGSRAVVVEAAGAEADRRARTADAVARALGAPAELRHRPDGRPELDGHTVSAAHSDGLTLAVVGQGRLACDAETVRPRRAEDWAALLGEAQLPVRDLLVAEAGDDPAVAATRVWCALECLRKSAATGQALALDRVDGSGWAVLSAGDAAIATWVTTVTDREDPVVFAFLAGKER
ncbi:SDR family NAD(P)-dependent oxidoreductase [Streptomyces kaniharaensis]|uniref:PksE n=1 Tax=Streptomyces kaniharaensis TaxID=212423 RepID=Q84HL8_9ACTN|nr:type I polyketide synthase [Streptomyces kaniharaensis]AAO25869.1 PksE [Streptomyces kaniharaensis]MQS10765.1 SDR family NAD(P)-dependent oxidoreductase [Streptomyces kaniharaensis]